MTGKFRRVLVVLDRLATPVVAYRSYSLAEQNRALLHRIRIRRNATSAAVLLVRNVVQWSVAVLATPLCLVLRAAGLRFFMVDLTQIGSVMWMDLFLRETRLGARQPRAVFVCRSAFTDANPYLLDLYDGLVTYIRNPFLKLLVFPFFVNPWFRDQGFRYEAPFLHGIRYPGQGSFGYGVCRDYNARFKRPLVQLGDEDLARGAALMAPLMLPGAAFVVVHVRDAGFYGDRHRTTRNADIRTYEPAFRYLIDRGFHVVRLGDPAMTRIDDMIARCGPRLIDYAHSDMKSDFLDIYLSWACDLFIGSNSGMHALPIVLNKSSIFLNFYNATTCLGYRAGDVSTFKKIRRGDDGSLVPFEALLQPPLSENPQVKELEQLGLYIEDSSPEDILRTVREYFELAGSRPSPRQKRAKAMIPPARHGYEAEGDFSETVLEAYFPDAGAAAILEREPQPAEAGLQARRPRPSAAIR